MAKSNTKIGKQSEKKGNTLIVETIISAKKSKKWKRVAELLSSPRKNRVEKNLQDISEEAKDGETIIVPGKVLSVGELDKKIKVAAFSFSKSAEEKISKSGSKMSTIMEEIKANPEARGVKILE